MRIWDLHSHVLPKLDDGAKDSDTSLAMLQYAEKIGISFMALTPHYYSDRLSIEDFLAVRAASWARLEERIAEEKAVHPQLLCGAEVHLSKGLSTRENLERLCYENTDLFLLELPYDAWESWVYRETERLIVDHGMQIVLAHPERYLLMPWEFKKKIKPFLEMGVVFQLNAESFSFRKRVAFQFMESGLPCILGSDTHNMKERKNQLDQAVECIEKFYGKDTLEQMMRFAENRWGDALENGSD